MSPVPPRCVAAAEEYFGPEVPYLVGKTLGRGSFGTVKLGIHRETGQQVALKILNTSDLVANPHQMMQTENEILLTKLLDHANILKLYDVILTPQHVVLVLEYVQGGALLDMVQNNLSPVVAFEYFHTLLLTVEHCHNQGVCHRDLKLDNILVDSMGHLKLADFGLATRYKDGERLSMSCGSPHYASPQVLQKLEYDGKKNDVWSLGVICYVLMLGTLPFDAPQLPQLQQQICKGEYSIPVHQPMQLQQFLSRLLCVDEQQRASISEVKQHPWWLAMCRAVDLDSQSLQARPKPMVKSHVMSNDLRPSTSPSRDAARQFCKPHAAILPHGLVTSHFNTKQNNHGAVNPWSMNQVMFKTHKRTFGRSSDLYCKKTYGEHDFPSHVESKCLSSVKCK
uniref:Protein kinase domain-containing protein n=1 Tax=Eutreptiella gymnastica TaxID=73025 RepID=A0A7S1HXF6_9EUGL|mmetsp:Transcript_11270/g.20296  ORF Transcript_11270/g.20296 Transcript_11270/m.20296 type:complete len:395 (+) Transcript_11270:33-1217(+)